MNAKADLDASLLAAHANDDRARLVSLYTSAADLSEKAGQIDATCFYLTHAYVFALDRGLTEANALHTRLLLLGREE